MTTSIYHFFKFLVEHGEDIRKVPKLEKLDFSDDFVSSKTKSAFPDLAIKINVDDDLFTGGELIEFKSSESFNIASFNSSIPVGKKTICDVVESQKIRGQMEKDGNNIDSVSDRDVYYLLSGKDDNSMKVVLVHGSFFETIPVRDLIVNAFAEMLKEANSEMTYEEGVRLAGMFSDQKMFSQFSSIEKAAVKIRFEITTEAETEANLLNSNMYPEIKQDTINLCIPYGDEDKKADIIEKYKLVMGDNFQQIDLTHKISEGKFIVFQTKLDK